MRQAQTCAARARHQAGSVMLVAMVMLLMLTLIAVGVVRLSSRHTLVVNNEQVRTEAVVAANYALDLVINEPATTWTDLKNSTGRVMHINLGTRSINFSEANTVNVTVRNMSCKRGRLIKNSELLKDSGGVKYVEPSDSSCFGGASNTGLTIVDPTSAIAAGGDSNCAAILYEVEAEPADAMLLDARARVVQGVEVRSDITGLSGNCP